MDVAIVDDDKDSRNYLEGLLKSFNYFDITVTQFDNGQTFIEGLGKSKFSLIFLDIEMPEINGISLAKEIHSIDAKTLIIFVINHSSYISEAIRNYAFQYLVKPVKNEELTIELTRAHKELSRRNQKIEINVRERKIIVNVSDIEYIESRNKKVVITMRDKTVFESKGKLSDYSKLLSYHNFSSCHKSYLINLEYVKEIGHESITMAGGRYIPVSRSQRDVFKKAYNMYLNDVIYD